MNKLPKRFAVLGGIVAFCAAQLLSMLLSSLTYLSLDLKEGSDGGEHQEAGYGHHSNVCPQHSILEHHRHCSQLSHQR